MGRLYVFSTSFSLVTLSLLSACGSTNGDDAPVARSQTAPALVQSSQNKGAPERQVPDPNYKLRGERHSTHDEDEAQICQVGKDGKRTCRAP